MIPHSKTAACVLPPVCPPGWERQSLRDVCLVSRPRFDSLTPRVHAVTSLSLNCSLTSSGSASRPAAACQVAKLFVAFFSTKLELATRTRPQVRRILHTENTQRARTGANVAHIPRPLSLFPFPFSPFPFLPYSLLFCGVLELVRLLIDFSGLFILFYSFDPFTLLLFFYLLIFNRSPPCIEHLYIKTRDPRPGCTNLSHGVKEILWIVHQRPVPSCLVYNSSCLSTYVCLCFPLFAASSSFLDRFISFLPIYIETELSHSIRCRPFFFYSPRDLHLQQRCTICLHLNPALHHRAPSMTHVSATEIRPHFVARQFYPPLLNRISFHPRQWDLCQTHAWPR
jgi:hypothetical protein